MKFFRQFSVICLLCATAARGIGPTDLGQGLGYLRIHSLADEEPALRRAVTGAGALVLDLRYATANEDSVAMLRATLAGRADAAPLLVLVGPATPALVGPALGKARGVFTLGIVGSKPEPDVIVKSDAAADRRAYDALEAGTALEKLISGKIEKQRFDEATLVKEFKNGNSDAEPPPAPDPTASKPAAAPEKTPAPVDRVLQRAVHLHQGLLALRRSGNSR